MTSERKQYQSYHTLSPREYMYFPRGTIDMGKPGQSSRLELFHLSLSIIVLTIGFAFALTQSSLLMMYLFQVKFDIIRFGYGLLFSFLGVLFAFVIHELSHKFMAQKHGLWSEFRMYPKGLLISLLLSIISGFVLAAPGAVMFRGEPRPFEQARIAIAGPGANITLAAVLYVSYQLIFLANSSLFSDAIAFIIVINAILGFFNILPFGPLDGVLIFEYNKPLWILLFISSLILIILVLQLILTFLF
jgi:Zn-dependent protease